MERLPEYSQVCVWPGCCVNLEKPEESFEANIKEFADIMLEKLGVRVQYLEEVSTLPDQDEQGELIPETGGRNDLLFAIHTEDVMKFAVPRLQFGIRWIEDALDSNGSIYPADIHRYYHW